MIVTRQKGSLLVGASGLILLLSTLVFTPQNKLIILSASMLMLVSGSLIYFKEVYGSSLSGIKNNGVWFNALTAKGIWGWVLGMTLTAFYVAIYWFPEVLGFNSNGTSSGFVSLFDPLSYVLNGNPATQWFLYGTLYTLAILIFGVKFIWKYRHNRYQIIRTVSVMFFQLCFAFLIPEILGKLNPETPYFAKDLKNMWPLNYYFLDQWHLKNMLNGGNLGLVF